MMMNDKVILYATFYDPIKANIMLSILEDAGFQCFLEDEKPRDHHRVRGVSLMVFERDMEQIKMLISIIVTEGNVNVSVDDFKNDDVYFPIYCPFCGSGNVEFGPTKDWWLRLLSRCLYPFKVWKRYYCNNCKREMF